MATTSDLVGGARVLLRDFPHYFEIDEGPLNVLTVRLPHPMISAASLQVYIAEPTPPTPPALPQPPAPTKAWTLDERNGLLKLSDPAYLGKRVIVAGYYFSWFTDSDLAFHADQVVGEMGHYSGMDLDDYAGAQIEVIELGTVVHALWSLALELSLDIDVSTPEGMFIPAHQRYTQVLQMVQTYEGMYNDKAAMLNMGLGAMEIFRLRRVSYQTGRYVPVYQEREIDDPRWPKRLYPPIPYGVPPENDPDTDIVEDVANGTFEVSDHVRGALPYGSQDIGWTSIGTRGDYP